MFEVTKNGLPKEDKMKYLKIRLCTGIAVIMFLSGCSVGTQYVLVGEAPLPGGRAVAVANNMISNANASGCKAISVGGYGLAPDDAVAVVGIPVLVDCPKGTKLLPDGTISP
jgi:hypothetical protein